MQQVLTAAELLRVWEQGRTRPAAARALLLMTLVTDPNAPEPVGHFSIGRRDAELLQLREELFGPEVVAQADCPECRQPVEMTFAVADVCHGEPAASPKSTLSRFGDWELEFRLPNSADLASLPHGADLATQRQALLSRCVSKATRHGETVPASQLPDDIVAGLSERMSELDPGGDMKLALTCPHCGHQWRALLDIVSFLWSELDAWAGRLLRDVHVLASAYGWREADILAMSATRRQAYLEMM